jgi:hypothetical protein
MKWSEDNSVLTDAQFGFRPGYGTPLHEFNITAKQI